MYVLRITRLRIVSGFDFKSGNNVIYVHYSVPTLVSDFVLIVETILSMYVPITMLTIVSSFGFKGGNNLTYVRTIVNV